MVHRGEDFGFPLKPGEPIAVRSQGRRHDLDGDLTLQLGIGGPIDFTHAAGAELRGDLVDADSGAWSQGQVAGSTAVRAVRT
jgi:hypothetical protein